MKRIRKYFSPSPLLRYSLLHGNQLQISGLKYILYTDTHIFIGNSSNRGNTPQTSLLYASQSIRSFREIPVQACNLNWAKEGFSIKGSSRLLKNALLAASSKVYCFFVIVHSLLGKRQKFNQNYYQMFVFEESIFFLSQFQLGVYMYKISISINSPSRGKAAL